jgi:hypothetical protein
MLLIDPKSDCTYFLPRMNARSLRRFQASAGEVIWVFAFNESEFVSKAGWVFP